MEKNMLMKITDIFWMSIIFNAILFVTNPLLIATFFMKQSVFKFFILIVAVVFATPSITAMLKALSDEPHKGMFKEYFYNVKKYFFSTIKNSSPFILMYVFLLADIYYINNYHQFQQLIIVLYLLFMINTVLFILGLIVNSEFIVNFKETLKISCYLLINKLINSAVVCFILFVSYIFAKHFTSIYVLLGIPITLWVIKLMYYFEIKDIKKKFYNQASPKESMLELY